MKSLGALAKKIQELEEVKSFSKHDQLVNGIINAIDAGIYKLGHSLPSINQMIDKTGYARQTIVKAYEALKERGIIASKKRLGYYVLNTATDQQIRVALVLFAFHEFQEQFYNAFRERLGPNAHIDVFFHHNNMGMMDTIVESIIAKYGMYVVAPIPNIKTRSILQKISSDKLLVVDRYADIADDISYIVQEFETPMYEALSSLQSSLNNFKKFILYYRPQSDFPIEVLNAFKKYMNYHKLDGEVQHLYTPRSVQKGTVYMPISDTDLWEIIKDCKEKGFKIGKDVGILSQNDTVVKSIISGGITTFSTDFRLMGSRAAEYVLNKDKGLIQEIIPSNLIKRKSL